MYSWVQTFDAVTYGLVQVDLVLFRETHERRRREHLRRRAETKQHLWLHRSAGLDVGNSKRLLIDHAIAADDRNHRTRRVSLFQLLGNEPFRFGEIGWLRIQFCWHQKRSTRQAY